MCQDKRKQVILLLEGYADMCRKVAVLRYELEHPVTVSPDEMIEALCFAKGDGEGHSSGHISNKTLYIAMNYQTEAARFSRGVMDEIVRKLLPLEREIERLDYYLSFLDTHQREVIQKCFFEELPLQRVAEELSISVWSVRKHRDEAVEKLTGMYNYVGKTVQ